MAIAIFRSLEGESVEDVANRLFQQWRLGKTGLDNGVLLVVFVQDRKLRFEIGYGLEAVVPDAAAGQIIRQIIAPSFRDRRYAAGLEAAADAVYARIASGGSAPGEPRRRVEGARRGQGESEQAADLYALLFLGLAALTIGGIALQAARQRGSYSAGRGGRWYSSGPVFWGGGGGWDGGGGGFSGGGGESGGGGASGGW